MGNISDAQKRAHNKYMKKAYKQFNVKLKPLQMAILDNYCKTTESSKNNFAVVAIIEKLEKETGKTFNELAKTLDNVEHQEETK